MKSKEQKKEELGRRNVVRLTRSAQDQINELNCRLGKNVGAVKERARLELLVEAELSETIAKADRERLVS